MTKFGYKFCCIGYNFHLNIKMTTYFENVTIELHVLFVLNTHVNWACTHRLCMLWLIEVGLVV